MMHFLSKLLQRWMWLLLQTRHLAMIPPLKILPLLSLLLLLSFMNWRSFQALLWSRSRFIAWWSWYCLLFTGSRRGRRRARCSYFDSSGCLASAGALSFALFWIHVEQMNYVQWHQQNTTDRTWLPSLSLSLSLYLLVNCIYRIFCINVFLFVFACILALNNIW